MMKIEQAINQLRVCATEPAMPGMECCQTVLEEIKRLQDFIQSDYDQFHSHHPYAVKLREKFPWLVVKPMRIALLELE